MKVVLVIVIGLAVGVAIELVLARRQRARRVVLDPPDLPPGFDVDLYGETTGRRRRSTGPRITDAPESSLVFDDDGGFRILGPVEHDAAPTAPWDDPVDDRGPWGATSDAPVAGDRSEGSDGDR